MIAPSGRRVRMPITGGFVGMVDREHFDEWLRQRARAAGADRCCGEFEALEHDGAGHALVHIRMPVEVAAAARPAGATSTAEGARTVTIRARVIVGADGARSEVARQAIPGAGEVPCVFAYHEIVAAPEPEPDALYEASRCDVYYQGHLSPDFYGWVFPHGKTVSVGVGSAIKGFSIRRAVSGLRAAAGLAEVRTVRREGAPIPLRPLRRWDNGRDVVLAGDAAGVVAPASGEGIYYAMAAGRFAADAAAQFLATGDSRCLRAARRRFMRAHGRVFWVLGMMQRFWYSSDRRRERFVAICEDPDVQYLTWQAYMHKKLVRARPLAHVRIFFKDLAHLLGSPAS
jgi:geranylgeranyl reductase